MGFLPVPLAALQYSGQKRPAEHSKKSAVLIEHVVTTRCALVSVTSRHYIKTRLAYGGLVQHGPHLGKLAYSGPGRPRKHAQSAVRTLFSGLQP